MSNLAEAIVSRICCAYSLLNSLPSSFGISIFSSKNDAKRIAKKLDGSLQRDTSGVKLSKYKFTRFSSWKLKAYSMKLFSLSTTTVK